MDQKTDFVFQRVVNMVSKGENAGNQQFLLFSQWFRNTSSLGSWEWVKAKKPFENIVEKGEIACTSDFSFSRIISYTIKGRNYHFCYI